MKKLISVYPLLFAMFPILALYAYNISELSPSELLLPLIAAVGLTLLLLLLLWVVFRNIEKAGIIASIFLVLFFSYGHAYNVLLDLGFPSVNKALPFLWAILLACGIYLIGRTRKNLSNMTNVLGIISISLVLITSINISIHQFSRPIFTQEGDNTSTAVNSGENKVRPDIYYIILDGYAASSTLKEVYDYDNHEFTDFLTESDFYVASKSCSNYAATFLSLASSLNIEYINYLTDAVGLDSQDRTIPYQMIEKNEVTNILKKEGYRFIHFSSGWGATDYNEYADLNFQCNTLNEFRTVLIQTTALRIFDKALIGNANRERILCTFSKLAEIPNLEGPNFVFAHINCPHPPYLFGANGETIPVTELSLQGNVWAERELYLNQLLFVNKKVEILVDEILSASEVPPIIILQADHGSASTFCGDDSGGWDSPTENMLRERMRIFNAYYVQPYVNDILYESISPVNTFRVIFNSCFGANYGLLKDETYYSTYDAPYEFINVTDTVKYD